MQRYLKHYGQSGHIWQCRFKAFATQDDEHLIRVVRYVERNPLRAGLRSSLRIPGGFSPVCFFPLPPLCVLTGERSESDSDGGPAIALLPAIAGLRGGFSGCVELLQTGRRIGHVGVGHNTPLLLGHWDKIRADGRASA